MLSHCHVAQDVVVDVRVLVRSEVPRLLLGIVGFVLEPLQLVVEVDDVESLANGISQVLSLSDEKWRAMSEMAFSTVKQSSWDAID